MAEDAFARPLLGGRYRCDRLLKSGSGVETFAGVDTQSRSPVIIKRVADGGVMDRPWVRLAHEAEVLRRMESSSFRAPVTTGRDDGAFYMVRPAVEGITLAERLTRGPLSFASALRVGICLLDALQQAHDHHVLHRDVKPANVIVDNAENLDKVVLIDFGFARSPTLDSDVRDERVGTARYLAPEAAGVLEREIDERSDLYSLGVVLFECIAGRPPFEAEDVGQLLRQHLNAAPASLRELRVDVPRALDAVVQRLLRKDPVERYQSAGAVLADLQSIQEAIARGQRDPVLVIGARDNRPVLTEPAFVGRTTELALLSHLVARAAGGNGGLVLVEAESGGGKSRLLDELALRVRGDAWVLRGQGVDQGAQRPFQVLDGVVQEIALAGAHDPTLAKVIRVAVGDRADAAVAALPDLAAVFGIDPNFNLGPEAYGENRSIGGLGVLLHALGQTGRPAVVLLDDCQWADASTLKLLAEWPTEMPCETVVIAAFRTEEVPADHLLRRAHPVAHVALAAFGLADVRSLAESMAGALPAAAVDTVASLSEGSPFMAAAVVRGLVEAGALVHEARGWRVDEARLADVQTSRRAALFLVRRLELLTRSTLELLTVGAILGKAFDADLAAELCGQDAATVTAGLAEAAQRRIVWPDEGTDHARFLHDKLREALLSRLGVGERAALHLRAATRIEALDPDRTFELAYHFDAGRRDDLALPYALRSAASARAQHSLDVALVNYRIAEAALGDGAERAEVAEALGDVLSLQGSYDEATDQFQAALEHASTRAGRAALLGKLGDVAFKRGDQRSARVHLEAAIVELGRRLPSNSVSLFFALLAEVVVQAAHTIAPRLFLHRRSPEGAEREFLAMRLYSRVAYVYWFSAGKVACAWAHLREMNLAERYPASAELAQAYSEHAPVMTMVPWFKRGLRYVERSLEIRTKLGDRWGQGQSLNFYGVVLYAASRHRDAIEKLEEAVRLLDQTGDRWEADTAMWNIAFARYRLGELDDAVRIARRLHEAATAIGDETASGAALSAWSRASAGQVPASLIRSQLERGLDDAQTDADVHVAEGVRLLAQGEFAASAAVMAEAAKIVKAAGLRQEYIAHVQAWLATALREQAGAASPSDLVARRLALRMGRKAARRAGRLAFFYANNAPHALRERALYAAVAGRKNTARRLLRRSLATAEAQDATYERLLTLRAWAQTGLDVQGTPAAVVLEAAEAELALLVPEVASFTEIDTADPPPSLSLIDRFSGLLATGRDIAAASTTEAVLDAVQKASVALLRGQQCEVIGVIDGAIEPLTPQEGSKRKISRTMTRRAIDERRVIATTETVGGEVLTSSDSFELSGVRSALCAPILLQGNVVALLYSSHAGFQGLFGADEVTMADFITTLAGAALEHVANTEAELHKMLDDLTVTSSLLNATLDATIDGILVVDREGRMTSYNQRFGEMWNIPADVLAARDDKEAITYVLDRLADPEAFVAKIDALYADPATESYDTFEFKDGRVFERGSKPQRIGSEVVGRVWSFRDVTERVRGEQALAIARDKAMEASRLKSEFVATTSHEIRTPMNGVIGLTGLLLETNLDDVQREYAEGVRLSAEALLAVINDILDFSKIEAGKLELEDVDFDLPLALDDLSSLVARGAAAKHLDLRWDCDPAVPMALRGDVGRLRQILLNLLANAVKFTHSGGVRVHVALVSGSDAEGIRLRFEVIDTGVGLRPEDRARLFEPFSQADASTTRRFGGTGLGLAICSRLAEAMGGVIGVESEYGRGSTFWIELPFNTVDARTGTHEAPPKHMPLQPVVPGERHGRILVAEDNAINQLVAKEMLRRLGYECDIVANGAEALEALRLRSYAAVLMDCYMPEMDGFAATRELRERERAHDGRHTPVIAMTALAMAEDRDRCTESGMDDYISKPVSLVALGATIDRWLGCQAVATG